MNDKLLIARCIEAEVDSFIADLNDFTLLVTTDEHNLYTKINGNKVKLTNSGGTIMTAYELRDLLQTLTGNDRLDSAYIKNIQDIPFKVKRVLTSAPTNISGDDTTIVYIVNMASDSYIPYTQVLPNITTSKTSVIYIEAIGDESKTITFTGEAGQTIDGENTHIINGGDRCILFANTSGWVSFCVSSHNSNASNTVKIATQEGSTEYNASKILFPFANGIVDDSGTVTVNTSFTVKDESNDIVPDCSTLEVQTTSLLSATQNDTNSNSVILDFKGIPTQQKLNTASYNALKLVFPQASVSGNQDGTVYVNTGTLIALGDDVVNAETSMIELDPNKFGAEIDQNHPNKVNITSLYNEGIEVTKDELTPTVRGSRIIFKDSVIEESSTQGTVVVKTPKPIILSGSDSYDDYKNLSFNENDFTIRRDPLDKINVELNGLSVEDDTEHAGIKLMKFDTNHFSLDTSVANAVDITIKDKTKVSNTGFLAVYNHRQVIASANAQEVYRTTTLAPNNVIWKDDSINYNPTTGLINLKYTGTNGEKQLFKLIARATIRRQMREADLTAYLYFVDNANGNYITDVNDETPIVSKNIEKELASDYIELATIISITQDTTIKAILKDDTPNKFVDILDLAMGTSAIMIEKIDKENQPSLALMNYELLTQQSMRFIKHEFGPDFENSSALISSLPSGNIDVSAGMNLQQDGWIIYFQDDGLYKRNTTPDGTADCLEIHDGTSGFGYFNITRVLDYEDTWSLRGHEITARVDRAEQSGEFMIVPVVWRRKMNEYTMSIITSMNREGTYTTTDGWEVIEASKTVIAAPTPPETTASFTCTYTVPDDAVNIGFMLMPTKQQASSLIKFTDFALGCDPTLEKWIVKYPEQAYEAQLKKDSKYVKFVQYNTTPYNMNQWYQIPNGTAGDNNYSPLYTGEAQSGGNADIQRIYDSSSSDFQELHNKGKWRFNKEGRVNVHIRVPVGTDKFADNSNHNTFRIGFVKDTASGDILQGTPITNSLRDINLSKSGNVWNDSARTSGYANYNFTMDVKENEEYWLAINPINVPRDSGNEGHIYSYPSGYVEFTFLENEYAINLLKSQVTDLKNLLRITQEALDNKVYIEVGYDSNNSKPTLEAKLETTI